MNKVKRSPLRLYLGKLYFSYKRRLSWHLSGLQYAKERSETKLEYSVFKHQSIILRKLKDVDMYLQENKKTNLFLASQRLNGIIIKPGETFSFWKQVGNTTARKGYLEGLILQQGKLTKGIGGGVCQLSNLIFWMTLHTPLKITERWRHSYDVFPDVERRLPFGSGATVAHNYIDLQIFNPTNSLFQLNLYQDERNLYGEWRSNLANNFTYRVFEKNHLIKSQPWGGYTRHNELYREVSEQGNNLIREEFITENNAIMMYNPLLEGGKV